MAFVRLVNLSSLPIVGNRPVYPIGVVSVAEALRSAGHVVEIIDFVESPAAMTDLSWLDTPCDMIGYAVRDVDPIDIARFSFVSGFEAFAGRVRQRTADAGYRPVFVGGGTGFTLFPEALGSRLQVDYVVRGEGEQALADLCRTDRLLLTGGPIECVAAPDTEFPDRQLTHPSAIVDAYLKAGRTEFGVETRRRKCVKRCQYCPYAFINDSALGHFKATDALEATVHHLYSLGVRHIFFTDAVFNNELRAAKRICRQLIEMGYPDLQWSAYFVPSGFDRELADLLIASHNFHVIFSPDSFDPRMLRVSGKLFGMNHVHRAKEICDAAGLTSAWMLLFGSAHETRETIDISARVSNEFFDDDEISINVGLRLLPGSPLARELRLTSEELLQPTFYPIDPRIFDWIREAFDNRFFKEERLLRYQSLRTSLAKMARRPFDNPIDDRLNYLLVQEREVGLHAAWGRPAEVAPAA